MTTRKKAAPKAEGKETTKLKQDDRDHEALVLKAHPGKTREQLMTEAMMSPVMRHAFTAKNFAMGMAGEGKINLEDCGTHITNLCAEVRANDLNSLTDMLAAQALTLDTAFTEMSRRAVLNAGQYLSASQQYMSMALKAQAGCRNTVETLARIKRGGKQVVKVIHVHEGGQAVVADTINQGGRRGASAENDEQPYEQASDAPLAALLSPDPERDGVPLSSFEGEEALPVTRGEIARSSTR